MFDIFHMWSSLFPLSKIYIGERCELYFFTYQRFLPKGSGYEIFDKSYFTCIAVLAAAMAVVYVIFRRLGSHDRHRFMCVMPLIFPCMEVCKQLVLYAQHTANIGMLPLHLCGLAPYVFILAAYLPSKKARMFFGEISVILLGPGAMFALVFPDWVKYPVINFFNIYGYMWHGMLVLYALLMLAEGELDIKISHIWYEIIFLCVIIPPSLIFDKTYDCNYMFINWPPDGTPLAWIASFMGVPGYLIGYALLAAVVMIVIYMIFAAIRKIQCVH